MSFLDLAKKRYSVRGYQDTPVPEEALMAVLEAGRIAPSAANFQPWHFIVVRDELNRKKFKPVYDRDWFVTAPVIIAVCLESKAAWAPAGSAHSTAPRRKGSSKHPTTSNPWC